MSSSILYINLLQQKFPGSSGQFCQISQRNHETNRACTNRNPLLRKTLAFDTILVDDGAAGRDETTSKISKSATGNGKLMVWGPVVLDKKILKVDTYKRCFFFLLGSHV